MGSELYEKYPHQVLLSVAATLWRAVKLVRIAISRTDPDHVGGGTYYFFKHMEQSSWYIH